MAQIFPYESLISGEHRPIHHFFTDCLLNCQTEDFFTQLYTANVDNSVNQKWNFNVDKDRDTVIYFSLCKICTKIFRLLAISVPQPCGLQIEK